MPTVDHYATLGMPPTATAAELRAAYRNLARRVHPDGFSDPAERRRAEGRMAAVNEAWRVLGDPGRRSDYDRTRAVATPATRPVDEPAHRTDAIKGVWGVWARALLRWALLVRREVGVFLRLVRREVGVFLRLVRREVGVFLSASRRGVGVFLSASRTEIVKVLREGAHAVSAEMREASEELRALRGRAPGGRAPANYGQIDARIPRDADDFETVCAEWMQMAGFSGVQRTHKGPDGGVDVIASIAVGQAKFHPSQKISAEAIRALVGSRIERGKDRALFFHYGPGYTAAAIDTAVNTKVELYQLDVESQRFVRVV